MNLRQSLSAIRWPIMLPFLALLAAGLAYSLWWLSLADRIEEELITWQATQEAAGLNVNWQTLERGGFPYRLEIRLTEPSLEWANAQPPVRWSADAINAQTLAYNLDHVILDAPGAHQISYPEKRDGKEQITILDMMAATFWASIVFENEGAERFALDLGNITLDRSLMSGDVATQSGTGSAERIQIHARPTPRGQIPNKPPVAPQALSSVDAALRAENIRWQDMGVPLWTGTEVELFEAQTRLSGLPDKIWAGGDNLAPDLIRSGAKLSVSEFKLIWGPIDMTGYGELELDDLGRPEGQFRTSVGNLPALIDALVAANVMSRQSATLAFAGLTALSNLQGEESGRVRLPVAMKEGVLFLGPVAAARLEPII